MGPLLVVTLQPFRGDLLDLIERLEHIGIEDFSAVRSIEPLDEGILIRFSGLDVPQLDPAVGTPGHKALCDEFRAIVEPNV